MAAIELGPFKIHLFVLWKQENVYRSWNDHRQTTERIRVILLLVISIKKRKGKLESEPQLFII